MEESQLMEAFVLSLQEKGIFQRTLLSEEEISISLVREYKIDDPEERYNFMKDIFLTAQETMNANKQNKE